MSGVPSEKPPGLPAEKSTLGQHAEHLFRTEAVYAEMRRLARRSLRRGQRGATLHTTDLIHEAYLKIKNSSVREGESYAQFLAIAALAMQQIVCDLARKRTRQRVLRERLENDELQPLGEKLQFDEYQEAQFLLGVSEALEQLAVTNERRALIVSCRFFAGLSEKETALAAGCSERTVQREWSVAREWLRNEIEK